MGQAFIPYPMAVIEMEKQCRFCKEYQDFMDVDRFDYGNRSNKELGPYKHDYTVAIVRRSWFEKLGKRRAGRSVFYRSKGIGYALNFCPECGRQLIQRKAKGGTKTDG